MVKYMRGSTNSPFSYATAALTFSKADQMIHMFSN